MPQVRLLRRAATEGTDAASVETRASTTSSSPQEQRLAELLAELPIGEVVDDVLQALEDNPNGFWRLRPAPARPPVCRWPSYSVPSGFQKATPSSDIT